MSAPRLYADLPVRRAWQLTADILVLTWVVAWLYAGRLVRDTVWQLLGPAQQVQDAGTRFGATMTEAGDQLARVPLVGDTVRRPFDAVAGSGADLADAGREVGETVERLGWLLGVLTALVPILVVGLIWALLRMRFVLRATAAQAFVDADEDLDLFALRAMARQPMHRLARVSDDPAGACGAVATPRSSARWRCWIRAPPGCDHRRGRRPPRPDQPAGAGTTTAGSRSTAGGIRTLRRARRPGHRCECP